MSPLSVGIHQSLHLVPSRQRELGNVSAGNILMHEEYSLSLFLSIPRIPSFGCCGNGHLSIGWWCWEHPKQAWTVTAAVNPVCTAFRGQKSWMRIMRVKASSRMNSGDGRIHPMRHLGTMQIPSRTVQLVH